MLKGHSYPKLYCKKLSNQKPTVNIVSTTKRTTLCWMHSEIITWGQRWRKIWQSSYFSHYPQMQTACANVVANLKCLHKLTSTRVFIAAEKWMVRRTGVGGFILGFHCHAIKNTIANHSIQKVPNLGNKRR